MDMYIALNYKVVNAIALLLIFPAGFELPIRENNLSWSTARSWYITRANSPNQTVLLGGSVPAGIFRHYLEFRNAGGPRHEVSYIYTYSWIATGGISYV